MLQNSSNLFSIYQKKIIKDPIYVDLNSYFYHSKPISRNDASKKYYLDRFYIILGTYGMQKSLLMIISNLESSAHIFVRVFHFLGCDIGGGGSRLKMTKCEKGEGVKNIDFWSDFWPLTN